MVCDHCLSHGPPALGLNGDFLGATEKKLWRKAIKAWNARVLDSDSFRKGIRAAASFVEGFDKYVKHAYRLSDCILGKFNQIGKRKIRKNIHQSTEGEAMMKVRPKKKNLRGKSGCDSCPSSSTPLDGWGPGMRHPSLT
jgi:hypothetical protein